MSRSSASTANQPEPFIVLPTSIHTHTLILLHGLGNNGQKFGTELLSTGISPKGHTFPTAFPGTKFIFPNARRRRSSAFRRAVINQWFDIASVEDPSHRRDTQVQGLVESAEHVRSIIAEELETIPMGNIVLGGLSQGCAMSMAVLLSLEFPLGGYFGMSGWLPFREDIEDVVAPIEEEDDPFADDEKDGKAMEPPLMAVSLVRDILSVDAAMPSKDRTSLTTPVLLCHGEDDEKVKCKLGKEAAQCLSSLGMQVTWKCYAGLGHWYKIPDEIDDIFEFLEAIP
jgi:predicted esterase